MEVTGLKKELFLGRIAQRLRGVASFGESTNMELRFDASRTVRCLGGETRNSMYKRFSCQLNGSVPMNIFVGNAAVVRLSSPRVPSLRWIHF